MRLNFSFHLSKSNAGRGIIVYPALFIAFFLLACAGFDAVADEDAPDVSAIFGTSEKDNPTRTTTKEKTEQSDPDAPDLSAIMGGDNSSATPAADPDAPDLGSIMGGSSNSSATPADSDAPDLGAIMGGSDSSATPAADSGAPDLGSIMGGDVPESPQETETPPPAEIVEESSSPVGPPPDSTIPLLYYYIDYGPKYVQYYLRKGPADFSEFIEKHTGLPLQSELYPWQFSGFVEGRYGMRTQWDKYERTMTSMGEIRGQIEGHKTFEWSLFERVPYVTWETMTFNFKGDVVGDFAGEEAYFDMREANMAFSPLDFADVKIGRQILTWGTGDMLFINDLFPKDWQSFFIGRDTEYLKAPSDALKVSLFSDIVNLDGVYVPVFNPDRYITGERLSYFNPLYGSLAGSHQKLSTDEPNGWFDNAEYHARAYRDIPIFDNTYQAAAYFYHGYWKSPGGFRMEDKRAIFPPLTVYGGSLQGPLGPGMANIEVGYYDSRDDRNGSDPLINNSQLRWLAGYEQNMEQVLTPLLGAKWGKLIGTDFTLGAQYYVEWMMRYNRYRDNLMPGSYAQDEVRHLFTLRATKLLMNQNLELSLFTYMSPTDVDAYMRPRVSYKISDYWTFDFGANVFIGNHPSTFFGQFMRDSNLYMGLRCSF